MSQNAERKPSEWKKALGATIRRGAGFIVWAGGDFMGLKDAAINDINSGWKSGVLGFFYHIGFPLSSAAITWKHNNGNPNLPTRIIGNTGAVLGGVVDVAAWSIGGGAGRLIEGGVISALKGIYSEKTRPMFPGKGKGRR